MHHFEDLIAIFNECFFKSYNTQLVKGEDEPIYLIADENYPYHRVVFAHGFFASALHECSHWLIAGENRRKLVDFGYWYVPDGRNAKEQELFQVVEVKPQALEWVLSRAAGYPFRISADNLSVPEVDPSPFKDAVHEQVRKYCEQGLPKRASMFHAALCKFYGTDPKLKIVDFDRHFLDM